MACCLTASIHYLNQCHFSSRCSVAFASSQWRHNGRNSVSTHQPHDCLLNGLFRLRSKNTWKLRVTGLCVGNSLGTGEFPAQMASNAENVSIWWRHHVRAISMKCSWTSSVICVRGLYNVIKKSLQHLLGVHEFRDHFVYAPNQWETTSLIGWAHT